MDRRQRINSGSELLPESSQGSSRLDAGFNFLTKDPRLIVSVFNISSERAKLSIYCNENLMKAFVAGATGETGRRIVQELVKRQIPVRAMVRDIIRARAILPAEVEFEL